MKMVRASFLEQFIKTAKCRTILSNQDISGAIEGDQIWSGTMHITGDIFVSPNVTLTIEPGTIIKLAANSDDQHFGEKQVRDELTGDKEKGVWKDLSATNEYAQFHTGFNMQRTLIAIGTPDKQIIFTPDSASPYHLDWAQMVMKNGTIQYCIFEWVHAGPNIANGVFSNNIVGHRCCPN